MLHRIKPFILGKQSDNFISTWDTTKTSVGSSNNNQIKLPLVNGGTFAFKVNWGDGLSDTITVWNQAETTHTYAATGIYQIEISGILQGFAFSNAGDRLKLLSIQNGGNSFKVADGGGQFYGCANLTSVANMNQATTGIANMTAFFRACSYLNCNLDINTASCTNMYTFMYQATLFNYPVAHLDITNVANLNLAFSSAGLSNSNYSDALIAWNARTHQNSVTLAASAKYEARALAARTDFVNNHSWIINDGGAA